MSSVFPLSLDKILGKNAVTKHIIVTSGAAGNQNVPVGKHWLILFGRVCHTTLTATILTMDRDDYAPLMVLTVIDAAEVTSCYPMFNTKSDARQAQWSPVIMSDNEYIRFASGAADVSAYITVLEW